MKQLILTISFFAIFRIAHTQCEDVFDNLPFIENYYRDVPLLTGGLFWEESFFLEVTQQDYSSSLVNSLWVAGESGAGNLFVSHRAYNPATPGPINDETGRTFENPCEYFNRAWIISGSEIRIHKDNYLQENIKESNTPKDILEWPAIGNPHFDIGEENANILQQELAPFYDTNLDGIYNALDGDIPIFKGELDFESFDDVWAPYIFSLGITNDGNSGDGMNAGNLKLDILHSSYLLNCPNRQDLNYTVFYNFNIKYKGELDLNNVRMGYFEDGDLGCYDNDLLGCYPPLNTSFVYNEDPSEDFCIGGVEPISVGWGLSKNTILLSHDMKSYLCYNNLNVGNPQAVTVDPNFGFEVYNYLNAQWLDGSPVTVGGSGYNPGSADETSFMFPDLPNDFSGWSMATTTLANSDVRSVMGIETQSTLTSGDNVSIDIASQVFFDPSVSHFAIFEKLEEGVREVQEAYNTMQNNPQELEECYYAIDCEDGCVWPGNILTDDRVDAQDMLFYGVLTRLGDDNGEERDQKGGLWAPHNAEDWDDSIFDIDLKHADCNGDGTLNESDIQIFNDNFGLSISGNEVENEIEQIDFEGFKVELDKSEIDLTGTTIGRFFNFKVRPREEGESFDFPYHGVSFDVVFDSSLMAPNVGFGYNIHQEYFDETIFADAFYKGIEIGDSFELFGDNRITVVVTSMSGENQFPNSDIVAEYSMVAIENATTSNLNGIDTTELRLENIKFMDASGNFIEEDVGYYTTELIISGLGFSPETSSVNESLFDQSLKVVPNPSFNEFTLQSENPLNGVLRILNLDGAEIERFFYRGDNEPQHDISHYKPGVYILQIRNTQGQIIGIKRLVVVK